MTLLAKRYAAAMHALAVQQSVVDAVADDLAVVHASIATPAAKALLTSPDITAAERGVVLDKLCAGRHALVRTTIGVLQHRRRLEVLFDLHGAFRALVMASRGEVEGVAEAPYALGDDELSALTALAGRLSGKKVRLSTALRPELLGGVRLRIGNVLYDGSLRASLDQLGQRLAQAAV
jgi:F-type H+-transporting ATPase subunit delta